MASTSATIVSQRGLYASTNGTTNAGVNGAAPGSGGNPNFISQVTLEEIHHDELEITQHPIEQGAPITDHAFKRPAELTLHLGWSPSQPVSIPSINQLYSDLRQGQANRVLYTVYTAKAVYQNMIIKALATQTDYKTANVLLITITMQQVLFANTQQVSAVPAAQQNQAAPQKTTPVVNAGTVNLTSAPNANVGAFPSPL